MSCEVFQRVEGSYVSLPRDDIDTDQIIPARFLTATTQEGLGPSLFADWRYREDGSLQEKFELNTPPALGAVFLAAGANFGCGSSREHAVWALRQAGFRAVISTSFADIFRANALRNGLVTVAVEEAFHRRLLSAPGGTLRIDLVECAVRDEAGVEASFAVDPFARHCLLNGIDSMTFLLESSDSIQRFESQRSPYETPDRRIPSASPIATNDKVENP